MFFLLGVYCGAAGYFGFDHYLLPKLKEKVANWVK